MDGAVMASSVFSKNVSAAFRAYGATAEAVPCLSKHDF